MKPKATPFPILLVIAAGACGHEGDRSPQLRSNPNWIAAATRQLGDATLIENRASRELMAVRRGDGPVSSTRLVFWGDQPVAIDSAGYHFAANSEGHEILMFDPGLDFLGALSPQDADGRRIQRPQVVAAGPGDRLAAFEAAGSITLFDRWGREFRRLEPRFAYAVGAWGPRARLILSRSPFTVPFNFEPEDPPLLIAFDPERPEKSHGIGQAHEALQSIYIHAANAGGVTVDSTGHVYYAALARPEVHKYAPDGSRVWVSRRPVDFGTPEPRLVPNPEGTPRLLLPTVQRAIAIGPDGLIYVRTAADSAGSRDRLDVLDPARGIWLRSAALDTSTAVLIGRRGAVWELPRGALLADRSSERREFRSFTLETFDGDRLTLEDLKGKVTLIAFWASWCGPCREELPLLDSLRSAVDQPDFQVIGLNEDVNESDARAFAEELRLQMTLLAGKGRMRQRYHYSGLPYTVLLDREGRIIREYYGFGGRAAFDVEVAGRVHAELGHGEHVEDTAGTAPTHEHAEDSSEPVPTHPRAGPSGVPAHPHEHDHGSDREVTGDEIAALILHQNGLVRLQPDAFADVPYRHWEIVRSALAQIDVESNGFMEEYSGSFELVQLLSLKTQLHVDVERFPELGVGAPFREAWRNHIRTIEFFLSSYQQLSASDR